MDSLKANALSDLLCEQIEYGLNNSARMDNFMDKRTFRSMARKNRDAMNEKLRLEKSNLIFEQLIKLPLFQKSENLFIYLSFRSEVNTWKILDYALEQGKFVYAPITLTDEKKLLCCKVDDPKKQLQKDSYGILSPYFDKDRIVSSQLIDLVLVPGLAFDLEKHRMGYGGGYYDRFVTTLSSSATTLALAFEEQLYEKIPLDPYDMKADHILTEKRFF